MQPGIGHKLHKIVTHPPSAYGANTDILMQVFYVGAAVLGGCSSALSSNSLGTTYGVNIPTALLGGIMLLLGSRLGAGCPR